MDLVGPMQTESIGGKKSILDLVDDFPWVSFLHDKSEAFKSKCSIEYKLRRMHPVLASFDSERENASFAEYCNEKGIKHEFSIAAQQNGGVFLEIKGRWWDQSGRSRFPWPIVSRGLS